MHAPIELSVAVICSQADTAARRLSCYFLERLDFDVHAGRQIQLHQRIHRLLRRLENVEQPLVRPDFKLLARLLVHVRRAQHAYLFFTVGSGIGPATCAPVRFAVSTISVVD